MCQVKCQIGCRRSEPLSNGLTTSQSSILQQGVRVLLVDIDGISHGAEGIGQRRLVVFVELTYKPDSTFCYLSHRHVLGSIDNRGCPVGESCGTELVVVGHCQQFVVVHQCEGVTIDMEGPVVVCTVATLTKGLGNAILIDYLPLHGVVCRVVRQIVCALLGCYVRCRQLHALGAPLDVSLWGPACCRILEPIDGLSVPVGFTDDFFFAVDDSCIIREYSHNTILVEFGSCERQCYLL